MRERVILGSRLYFEVGVSCDLMDSGDRGLWVLRWSLKNKVVMQTVAGRGTL
jgi:hypothetical protein